MGDQTGARPDLSSPETSYRGHNLCWFVSYMLACITCWQQVSLPLSLHPFVHPSYQRNDCGSFLNPLWCWKASFNPSLSNFSCHYYKIQNPLKWLHGKRKLNLFIVTNLHREDETELQVHTILCLTSLFPLLNSMFWLLGGLLCGNSIISGWFYGPGSFTGATETWYA